jgi:hypothetical protein
MVIFSIGLPGRFSRWCDTAIGKILSRLGGTVVVKAWPPIHHMLGYDSITSALEEAALTLIGTEATHLVMGARHADEKLLAALADTNARFVLTLDDPRMTVAEILRETGGELHAIARAVANCCPSLTRFGALPGALTISDKSGPDDAVAAISMISRHLQIAVSDAEAGGLADELADANVMFPGSELPLNMADQVDIADPVIDGALSMYAHAFAGDNADQIVWGRDLFILASDSNKRATDLVDIRNVSGFDRFLIYGPYIRVPPGLWTARVTLGLSEETRGHTFIIDAYAGGLLAYVSIQSIGGGVYTPEITFSLDASNDQGLEIRVRVGGNGATGSLALGNIVLRRIAAMTVTDHTGNSPSDFRTVLKL